MVSSTERMTAAARVTANELRRAHTSMLPPPRRSMLQFAEQEIVIPDGPYKGRRYRASRQPYAKLWFEAVDSGLWSRFNALGPTQTGKTLTCFATPTLYHLFEIGETVVCGVPDMEMAADKWYQDLLPVIEASRYKSLLPRSGSGSRGGKVISIKFGNGATLRFMSGGGGDKSRAGFTSRVLVVTETDGLGKNTEASEETDKLGQLEGRTLAWGATQRRLTYMECTVTVAEGRTWQEYTGGTQSTIAIRCPHCRGYVSPERSHLLGWRDAENDIDARIASRFCCPGCGSNWSEADRRASNADAVLLHKGQSVDADGVVSGDAPRVETLGFRWSAVNNMFLSAGDLGVIERGSAAAIDEDNAERKMCQQFWCVPYTQPGIDENLLTFDMVRRRRGRCHRGVVPADTRYLTVGIDLQKRFATFVLFAWRVVDGHGYGHYPEYGTFDIPVESMPIELATLKALRNFADRCREGWVVEGSDTPMVPQQLWVDSGYADSRLAVYRASKELAGWLRPIKGYGMGQQHDRVYKKPKDRNKTIVCVGQEYHAVRMRSEGVDLVHLNADFWKSWVHNRLSQPVDEPGAVTLYESPDRNEHIKFGKQITAERKKIEYVHGRGEVGVWKRDRRDNHGLDSAMIAAAAAHFCGARLDQPDPVRAVRQEPAQSQENRFLNQAGHPFLITERR